MEKLMDPKEKQAMIDSRMSKEEFELAQAEEHRRQNPLDYEEQKIYLEPEFKTYVTEKYPHA